MSDNNERTDSSEEKEQMEQIVFRPYIPKWGIRKVPKIEFQYSKLPDPNPYTGFDVHPDFECTYFEELKFFEED